MNQLKWTVSRFADKIGLIGILALLLIPCIITYWLLVLAPAKQYLHALKQQTPLSTPSETKILASPAEQFLSKLPTTQATSAELQTIFDIAAKHRLDMGEVTYKRERKQGEKLERYAVNFSLDAPYPIIKTFLMETLATLPYASLDQLAFDRDDLQNSTVLANIRLTFHLTQP